MSTLRVANIHSVDRNPALTIAANGDTTFNGTVTGAGYTVGSTITPSSGASTFTFAVPTGIELLKIAVTSLTVGGDAYHTLQLGHSSGTYPDGGYGGAMETSQNNTYYGNGGTTSALTTAHGIFYQNNTYSGVVECMKIQDSDNKWVIESNFYSEGSSTHDIGKSISQVALGAGNELNIIRFNCNSGNWTTTNCRIRLFYQ